MKQLGVIHYQENLNNNMKIITNSFGELLAECERRGVSTKITTNISSLDKEINNKE